MNFFTDFGEFNMAFNKFLSFFVVFFGCGMAVEGGIPFSRRSKILQHQLTMASSISLSKKCKRLLLF